MHKFFQNEDGTPIDISNINLENLNSMLGENLAHEIFEETAKELNMEDTMKDTTSVSDFFQKMFRNPGKLEKLMNISKKYGSKIVNKIESGELKESEVIQEVTKIESKLNNIPGMDNIKSKLNKCSDNYVRL